MKRVSHSTFGLLVIASVALFSCKAPNVMRKSAPVFTHGEFDQLLKKHVSSDSGWVDYAGFLADSMDLHNYLDNLSQNPPANNWTEDEEKAYWINAYNAYTIAIVIRNYPVESIRDIGPKNPIPFVNTVWDIKFINIRGEEFDLNNLEHAKLRKRFGDPRIHFAVNCASFSCPPLRAEAFVGSRLNQQLDEQGRIFVNDGYRNIISKDKLQLSKIFSWYGGDFKKDGKVVLDYIRKYSDQEIGPDPEIEFLDYKWSLNKQ